MVKFWNKLKVQKFFNFFLKKKKVIMSCKTSLIRQFKMLCEGKEYSEVHNFLIDRI